MTRKLINFAVPALLLLALFFSGCVVIGQEELSTISFITLSLQACVQIVLLYLYVLVAEERYGKEG